MSDEEEENSAEEEEDDDENEEEDDEEEEEDDEDGDGDDEEDGDEDEDEDQEQQQDEQEDGSKQESEQPPDKLPKFRSLQTQQFKFTNLLSEISSLSLSVDRFIDTLPSHGGTSYHRSSYNPIPLRTSPPQIPLILPREQSRVVIMKDEDTQVSMQPQIIIQPTKVEKQVQQPEYKISNESNKFLAQLYEQNKKLKRWQNSSHNVNTHQSALSSGFYGSRERFQRQQYEKGLFNVEERNKEIDQAIEMLKRERD